MTEKHTHTPGEWEHKQISENIREYIVLADRKQYRHIATVNGSTPAEALANAELIAKSPLLPEAIEALRGIMEKSPYWKPGQRSSDPQVRKAQDLIAKFEAKP